MPMQLDLFTVIPEWKPLRVAELPDLRRADIIGVDTETRDPDLFELGPGFIRGTGHVLGFSVAVEGFTTYVPIRHYSNNVDEPDKAVEWLRDLMKAPSLKLGANIHYDMDALKTLGIELGGSLYDVQVVDSLIDETLDSYSLENIAQRRLDEGKASLELKATLKHLGLDMGGLDQLDAAQVAKYAMRDASLLLEIHESQADDLSEYDLSGALRRECELTRLLWKMHQQGVPINLGKAEELSKKWHESANTALFIAQSMVPFRVDPNSNKSVARALQTMGIHCPLTDKGNPSVTNDWLSSQDNPFCQKLAEYRKLRKMVDDFVDGVFLKYEHNGRLYPQWFQSRNSKQNQEMVSGASTGRITGSKPNMTQIPVRNPDLGPLIRALVEAEHGELYGKFDFSSQEPRIGVHLAHKAHCSGTEPFVRMYNEDKRTDFHSVTRDMVQEKTGVAISRRDAKTINLGLMYGMQNNTLAWNLGLDMSEAQPLFRAYHQAMPWVGEVTQMAQRLADQRGYIRTLGGRIRRFNEWESTQFSEKGLFKTKQECLERYGTARRAGLHKAFNGAVQGSAADQMKEAIIQLDAQGILPLIQVYDELGVSLKSPEQAAFVAEVMENALPMCVPSLVEPEIGLNWGLKK